MRKISDNLYLDVSKISAVHIVKRLINSARETTTTLVVDGQKINCSEREFEIIKHHLGFSKESS